MVRFHAQYLDEPNLVFGNHGEEQDPRLGLRQFGPFHGTHQNVPTPSQVRVGIIGTGETIGLAKRVIAALAQPIPSREPNQWLYPDFEGFSSASSIKCDLVSAESWNATITPQEIDRVIQVRDANQRIAAAANLFVTKMDAIRGEDDPPHVVILSLPQTIIDYCGISQMTRGAKKPKFTPLEKAIGKLERENQKFLEHWGMEAAEKGDEPDRDYDLRNAIKGKVMAAGIPVQLLKEARARGFLTLLETGKPVQGSVHEVTGFAWDFSTGLYYKASGKPWRLARLDPRTCYVGVAFYGNLRSPDRDMETSMAQVFTHSGDGFVLRGADVVVDSRTKEPHLTRSQARTLLEDVLAKYEPRAGVPERIVIHKTSRFTNDERSGFLEVIGNRKYDLVNVNDRAPARFFRLGEFPVLRGTLITLTPREHLLFTHGFTPRVRAYPGRRIPHPLHLIHEGSSEIRAVAAEILGLTKLNWNTTQFATSYPITLEFAHRVGKVLSEIDPDAKLQDHYRFYM